MEFFAAVSATLLVVAACSAVTVWGCLRFQQWLVPADHSVMVCIDYAYPDGRKEGIALRCVIDGKEVIPNILREDGRLDSGSFCGTTLSVKSVDYGIGRRGPRRKIAYQASAVCMALFPVLYAVAGIFLCARRFYQKKLSPPILALEDAAGHISRQDLDFTVSCEAENELGQLCRSFEQMRQALYENDRELWKMLEERKMIQASIAHDLRNPITIIEGYAEYLMLHLQKGDLSSEKTAGMVDNIAKAAGRLEQYTESVRTIGQLDDIEIERTEVSVQQLISDITGDFSLIASERNIKLRVENRIRKETVRIDASVLYRVLENIVSNSFRYAKETIVISAALENGCFAVTVTDDGDGYPETVLKGQNRMLLPAADENGHCGMGLTIGRLLCRKHGGRLELSNRDPHGAVTKIIFGI